MKELRTAILVIDKGLQQRTVIRLQRGPNVLGRDGVADVVLPNRTLSRRHAEVIIRGDSATLRDLESLNGTYLNGIRVGASELEIKSGDRIEFGGDIGGTIHLDSGDTTLPYIREADPGIQSGDAQQVSADRMTVAVDLQSRTAYVRGIRINPDLSKKSFEILALLCQRRGQVCSKREIAVAGWPERPNGMVTDSEISQAVHRLRTAFETDPSSPEFIISIRGVGYRLVESAD